MNPTYVAEHYKEHRRLWSNLGTHKSRTWDFRIVEDGHLEGAGLVDAGLQGQSHDENVSERNEKIASVNRSFDSLSTLLVPASYLHFNL